MNKFCQKPDDTGDVIARTKHICSCTLFRLFTDMIFYFILFIHTHLFHTLLTVLSLINYVKCFELFKDTVCYTCVLLLLYYTYVLIVTAWFHATRAMMTIGLIGFILITVLGGIYMFLHSINKNLVIRAFTVLCFASG